MARSTERFFVTAWPTLKTLPNQPELMQLMQDEGLSPYEWSNAPGDKYPPHSHAYGKVIYVAKGQIAWILPESKQEVKTSAGDRLELAAGVVHAARVGPQGVTCLEAHV